MKGGFSIPNHPLNERRFSNWSRPESDRFMNILCLFSSPISTHARERKHLVDSCLLVLEKLLLYSSSRSNSSMQRTRHDVLQVTFLYSIMPHGHGSMIVYSYFRSLTLLHSSAEKNLSCSLTPKLRSARAPSIPPKN
jgi:hypothetical protein